MLMKQSLQNFLIHVGLFLLVEIIFVVIIFREFPPFNLLTLTGILHASYRMVVVVAWLIRPRVEQLWSKFVVTYVPIVYHVVIHVYMGVVSIEDMHNKGIHHQDELLWIIVGTLVAGLIIGFWEYILHRKEHLEEHHRLHHGDEECFDEM